MYSVSKVGRDGAAAKGKQPGPGSYTMPSSFGNKGRSMGSKCGANFMSGGTKTPGPGQYSVGGQMRPKTAGGQFGVKTGSSLAINPQTGPNLGPGSYYGLCRGGSSKNVK